MTGSNSTSRKQQLLRSRTCLRRRQRAAFRHHHRVNCRRSPNSGIERRLRTAGAMPLKVTAAGPDPRAPVDVLPMDMDVDGEDVGSMVLLDGHDVSAEKTDVDFFNGRALHSAPHACLHLIIAQHVPDFDDDFDDEDLS